MWLPSNRLSRAVSGGSVLGNRPKGTEGDIRKIEGVMSKFR